MFLRGIQRTRSTFRVVRVAFKYAWEKIGFAKNIRNMRIQFINNTRFARFFRKFSKNKTIGFFLFYNHLIFLMK